VELGARYQEIVARVIQTAVLFVTWAEGRLRGPKSVAGEFASSFRDRFPLLWEDFLREYALVDEF
jgi:hypothetical protein